MKCCIFLLFLVVVKFDTNCIFRSFLFICFISIQHLIVVNVHCSRSSRDGAQTDTKRRESTSLPSTKKKNDQKSTSDRIMSFLHLGRPSVGAGDAALAKKPSKMKVFSKQKNKDHTDTRRGEQIKPTRAPSPLFLNRPIGNAYRPMPQFVQSSSESGWESVIDSGEDSPSSLRRANAVKRAPKPGPVVAKTKTKSSMWGRKATSPSESRSADMRKSEHSNYQAPSKSKIKSVRSKPMLEITKTSGVGSPSHSRDSRLGNLPSDYYNSDAEDSDDEPHHKAPIGAKQRKT